MARLVPLASAQPCSSVGLRISAASDPADFVALNEVRVVGPGHQEPDVRSVLEQAL